MNELPDYMEEAWEELIDGKIVLMSPRPSFNHNVVAENIFFLFKQALRGKPCRAIADGTDLYLSKKERYVPDGMIVCDRSKLKGNGVHGAPDLVVEVLSPSSSSRDCILKLHKYQAAGCGEYWIVDPEHERVTVYRFRDKVLLDAPIQYTFQDQIAVAMSDDQLIIDFAKIRRQLHRYYK